MVLIEEYRYRNAIIRVYGEVDRETLEKATCKFMKKVITIRKLKLKEKNQNGNRIKSRVITKE